MCILYLWCISIWTHHIQMLNSHVWQEATILNSRALDDKLFQIITNDRFYLTFFFLSDTNRIVFSPLLVVYLWNIALRDGTEDPPLFDSSPPCLSTCTVYTAVLQLWMQTWILSPLLSSYMILSKLLNSSVARFPYLQSEPNISIFSGLQLKIVRW